MEAKQQVTGPLHVGACRRAAVNVERVFAQLAERRSRQALGAAGSAAGARAQVTEERLVRGHEAQQKGVSPANSRRGQVEEGGGGRLLAH